MVSNNNTTNQAYGSTHKVQDEGTSLLPKNTDANKNKFLSGRSIAVASLIAIAVLWTGILFKNDKLSHQQLQHPAPSMSSTQFLMDDSFDDTALFYDDQQVDHLHVDDLRTYSQRYYKKSADFGGPGHPILVIMGGEADLESLIYPFVANRLASTFHAYVLSPEHRFYGESQPVPGGRPNVDQMMKYLSPDQALEDAVQLIQYVRDGLGCSADPTHPGYCPVITFGGSYPGFLSAMMRFRYPDLIDISYASSAPLELYSQKVNSDAYYEKVTDVAELASPGCADAVRSTVFAVRDELYANYGDDNADDSNSNILEAAQATGFCAATFPTYVSGIEEFVSETIQYLVPAIFADFNMDYYPPSPDTALAKACVIFQQPDDTASPMDKINQFFELRGAVAYGTDGSGDDDATPKCFDLSQELPDGPNSRIRGSDNSGSGGGHVGEIWEFQCCKDLIIRAGYSEKSMFLPRHFSYEWHEQHCKARFPGIIVEPYRMNQQWGFEDLTKTSRIIFGNGLNDGWSTSSMTNVTELEGPKYDQLKVLNFPNGAHHSELAHTYPNDYEMPDIVQGYDDATDILAGWLDEIYAQQQ